MPLENGYLLQQRFRILDILGQGGMGAVYRAIDENLDITVAVKENSFFSEEYTRQFQREAKILASLRHPNLPRVFDYFVIDQQGQYLVMDYIEGEDLRQWISREDSISENEVIHIGIAICDALIYLHSRDPAITHRDIKPGNIKITPSGEVVLVDFGLVKLMNDKELTTTAARAMTPGYSPPEQYGESPTDHRSDIFSLGATLYAALAGYLPEDSLARTTGNAQLTPLQHYDPQISSKTVEVIEKALELRFEDRWQSAAAFKDALLDARESIPRSAWPSPRLAAMVQHETDPEVNRVPKSVAGKSIQKIFGSDTGGRKRLDPVWLIFGTMIILILLMLGVSLLWPEGLERIFARPFEDGPEETLASFVNHTGTATVLALTQSNNQGEDSMQSLTSNPSAPNAITPSATPIGGGTGMLAYVSERTGIPQIWLLNAADGETSQLTKLNDGACQPDWSPEGDQIVFTSPCPSKRSRYPGSSLYVIDIENGFLKPLPASLEGDFDPAWSPNGQGIVFTSLINGQMQLMKINLEDRLLVRLSDGSYDDSDAAWSPDGTRLVFVRIRSVEQIWLMDADGENPVQFSLSGLIDNSHPEWHPHDDLILFSQVLGQGSPSKQLYGMRLEDIGKAEEITITPGGRSDYIPLMDNVDVSQDGYWLAFDYWYFDVLSDIYIMTFPGANLIQLTDHPAMDYDPVWRPLP